MLSILDQKIRNYHISGSVMCSTWGSMVFCYFQVFKGKRFTEKILSQKWARKYTLSGEQSFLGISIPWTPFSGRQIFSWHRQIPSETRSQCYWLILIKNTSKILEKNPTANTIDYNFYQYNLNSLQAHNQWSYPLFWLAFDLNCYKLRSHKYTSVKVTSFHM